MPSQDAFLQHEMDQSANGVITPIHEDWRGNRDLAWWARQGYHKKPFELEHVRGTLAVSSELGLDSLLPHFTEDDWRAIRDGGEVFSGFHNDRFLGIAGVSLKWPGRAEVWALVGAQLSKRDMLWVTIEVIEFLEFTHDRGYRRLETTVAADHEAGHVWAEKLGFRAEGLLGCYGLEGQDHQMYARIRR